MEEVASSEDLEPGGGTSATLAVPAADSLRGDFKSLSPPAR